MEIKKYDVVIIQGKILQYIGDYSDNGVILQDIHTATVTTLKPLVERKATVDEENWFCENTEHINFIPPKRNN